uniref:Uncharacterized protein n=1 Tax=Kalanchoe fedtschenkoi TaxID=63787 RepID=A0A7N0VMM3_KALFE
MEFDGRGVGGGGSSRYSGWIISAVFVASIIGVLVFSGGMSDVEEELGAKVEFVLPAAVLMQRKTSVMAERAGQDESERSHRHFQLSRLSNRKHNVEFPSPRSRKRKVEEGLASARAAIRNSAMAVTSNELSSSQIYHNRDAFFR